VTATGQGNPKRAATTAHRNVGGEGCLVVVPTEAKVEVLNPVGGRIFELLDGSHSVEDIVGILVDEFEVSEEQARTDCDAFIGELRERNMLEVNDG
jgi:hypothetical protein